MTDAEQREQFDKLENSVARLEGVVDKLAQHVVTGFARVDERIDKLEATVATKEQVNAVYDLLDKNISEHEKQEVERAAMAHQLSRHDVWLRQLADHTGVELQQQS